MRSDEADVAAAEHVALDSNGREVGGGGADTCLVARLDIEVPDTVAARAARRARTGKHRYFLPWEQSDLPAEEHPRHVPRRPAVARPDAPEGEDPLSFEE